MTFISLEKLMIRVGIGLVSGWLASLVVGRGYGLVGDIVVGVLGSFLGGVIFRGLHVRSPVGGLLGTILVAFVGAVALLIVIRMLPSGGARRP